MKTTVSDIICRTIFWSIMSLKLVKLTNAKVSALPAQLIVTSVLWTKRN